MMHDRCGVASVPWKVQQLLSWLQRTYHYSARIFSPGSWSRNSARAVRPRQRLNTWSGLARRTWNSMPIERLRYVVPINECLDCFR